MLLGIFLPSTPPQRCSQVSDAGAHLKRLEDLRGRLGWTRLTYDITYGYDYGDRSY